MHSTYKHTVSIGTAQKAYVTPEDFKGIHANHQSNKILFSAPKENRAFRPTRLVEPTNTEALWKAQNSVVMGLSVLDTPLVCSSRNLHQPHPHTYTTHTRHAAHPPADLDTWAELGTAGLPSRRQTAFIH